MYKYLLVISLVFYTVFAKHEEVEGHTLYQVNVQNMQQVETLADVVARLVLDVWTYSVPGREGLILVPRDLRQAFQVALYEARIPYKVAVQNIKELLDVEDELLAKASVRSNQSRSEDHFYNTIHRYEAVNNYMEELARSYPNRVQVVVGGQSIEGRDIKYLRISTTNFQDRSKPVIFIQTLLHAREWITLPASLYAIHKLVVDVTDQDLVDNVDWIILPIANPDGYEFSHTDGRFWRKNRATGFLPNDICMGVDLNRNFDFLWGTASSNNVCTEIFHGLSPFSEPETRVIRDIFNRYRGRIELYADIHSFGSMILYGFGTGGLPPNALTLNLVGVQMAQAIDAVKWPQNRNYIVGNIVAILGRASGSSVDYAKANDVFLPYAYELPSYRNTQGSILGFLVDPDFIEQAGFETWEGLKAGARWVVNNVMMKQMK